MPNPTIGHQYLLSTLKRMIAINSILPHEKELVHFIANEIRKLGIAPVLDEVAPGRPNLYAIEGKGNNGKYIAFSGHSDTVDVAGGWQTDPFVATEIDGKLHGLGAINMKSGLACMLAAFKALVESGEVRKQGGKLGLIVTVDQEGYSTGARAFLNSEFAGCDAMLHAEHFFGDCDTDYLPHSGTGKVLYKLSVTGKAGHAFRPHLGGINAIDDAARIVTHLDELERRDHPEFGKGTVCSLKIDGGYQEYSLVVPEHCEVIVTRLTVPGETRESVIADMRKLIDSLRLKSEVKIEIVPPSYNSYRIDMESPFVRHFSEVYRQVVGKPPVFKGHKGITDANVFVTEGNIPTINFGPKGANHHRPGEYVEMSTLFDVANIYCRCAIDLSSYAKKTI